MTPEPENPTPASPRGGARPGAGRPTAIEQERRRLAAIGADPDALDPLRLLVSLAGDPRTDAMARVAAATVLALLRPNGPFRRG